MKIYYYYHSKDIQLRIDTDKTFGQYLGEIIDRASPYWNRMGYDVIDIRIRAYAIIYEVKKCLKNIKDDNVS
jgi:hypothetical protein